jgi:hypothetical protein
MQRVKSLLLTKVENHPGHKRILLKFAHDGEGLKGQPLRREKYRDAKVSFQGLTLCCPYQGAPGGLAEQLNGKFGLRTTGSDTKTDYSNNVGKRWKPNGNYVEYK